MTPTPSTPIQVLLCIDGDSITRLRTVWRLLAIGLLDHPVALRILTDSPEAQALAFGPIEIVRHRTYRWPFRGGIIRNVAQSMSENPPDIIHAASGSVAHLARALAQAWEAEFIYHVTSVADIATLRSLAPLPQRMRIIAASDVLERAIRDQHPLLAQVVTTIRPGLRTDKEATCFPDRSRIPTLLCCAPIENGSGVDTLIEAIALVRKRGFELITFFLNSGSQEAKVRRIVKHHGLSHYVTFASISGDARTLMHDSDIYVVPGVEQEILESSIRAMASGMAVVAVDGCVGGFYEHQKTALLCGRDSSAELATAVERLLDSHELAIRLATQAAEYMATRHSVSTMVDHTFRLYEEVSASRRTIKFS